MSMSYYILTLFSLSDTSSHAQISPRDHSALSRSPSPTRVNFKFEDDPPKSNLDKTELSQNEEQELSCAHSDNLPSELLRNQLIKIKQVKQSQVTDDEVYSVTTPAPVPAPRMSIQKKSLTSRDAKKENLIQYSANKASDTCSQFEPILSPRFVSEASANLSVSPPPRKVFTFGSEGKELLEISDKEKGLNDRDSSSKIEVRKRIILKPVSLLNKRYDIPEFDESIEKGFLRENNLSLESRINSMSTKETAASRRSLREVSSQKSGTEYTFSNEVDALRINSGKQDLIKLYDLPDGKVLSKSESGPALSQYREKQFITKPTVKPLLSEWERQQRKNLEEEEKNRLNRSLSAGNPVTAKIREIVKFPGGGLKHIFAKENKKADIMGTVDAADDIVFTRIPSGGKLENKKDPDCMKSPNMVLNLLQKDIHQNVNEESIYSDVKCNEIEHIKPSSPVYVKTYVDRFDSEILFGDGRVLNSAAGSKYLNNERLKDIARSKASPRHRNKFSSDFSGDYSKFSQQGVNNQINEKHSLNENVNNSSIYDGRPQKSWAFRRSLRERNSPDKEDSKLTNSNSATSLAELERKQRYKEAFSVFKKEKAANKKGAWHEERIPLYTSSWKFLAPQRVEQENEPKTEKDLPSFLERRSPPVRLTQIIGDSNSQVSSAVTTPLVSPRDSPDGISLQLTNKKNELLKQISLSPELSKNLATIPEPPPRKLKNTTVDNDRSTERVAEIKSATPSHNDRTVSKYNAEDDTPPPLAPKRKSLVGKENFLNPEKFNNFQLNNIELSDTYEQQNIRRGIPRYSSDSHKERKAELNKYRMSGGDSGAMKLNTAKHSLDKQNYYEHSSPITNQRIPRKERDRNTDRYKDNRLGYRHVSADRYTSYSRDRSKAGELDDRVNVDGRLRETERRVKVTTYKLGERLVRESTEKFRSPVGSRRENTSKRDGNNTSLHERLHSSDRSNKLLGREKDDEHERRKRHTRRREYEERRSELQRRSRSESRPKNSLRDRVISLDRDYYRSSGKDSPRHTDMKGQDPDVVQEIEKRRNELNRRGYITKKSDSGYYSQRSPRQDAAKSGYKTGESPRSKDNVGRKENHYEKIHKNSRSSDYKRRTDASDRKTRNYDSTDSGYRRMSEVITVRNVLL